jgi:hypothetical protein
VLEVEVRLVDVTSFSSPHTEVILAAGHEALIAMGWTPPGSEPSNEKATADASPTGPTQRT